MRPGDALKGNAGPLIPAPSTCRVRVPLYGPNEPSTRRATKFVSVEEARALLDQGLAYRFGRGRRLLRMKSMSSRAGDGLRDLSATMGPEVIEGNVMGWKRAQGVVSSFNE